MQQDTELNDIDDLRPLRRPSVRSVLQTIHLWGGLILAIPFVLFGISGSILMLQPEVPRLSIPFASAGGEAKSAGDILKAAEAVLPPGTRADRIQMPQRWREPAAVRFTPVDRDDRGGGNYAGNVVYVDAATLEILGTGTQRRPAAIFGIMRTLHATLYVRTISDRAFVGWLGIALTLLLLTGLVLWWPRKGRWRQAFLVKRGSRGFRLHHDLHSAFGIWTLLLFLVISVSGIYLAFPRPFRAAVGLVLPIGFNFADAENQAGPRPRTQPLTLDEAVAAAKAVVPNIEPLTFQLPNRPDRPYVLNFIPSGYGQGAPPILVSVDQGSGEVAYVDDFRTFNIGEKVVLWQRLLHSGLGLGILYKILVFFSGFLPLLFAITGIRMWWLKRRQRQGALSGPVPQAAE